MKVVSKKPLIHITIEEEKAIGEVAALLDTIHERLGNDAFNCEVDIDLKKGEE